MHSWLCGRNLWIAPNDLRSTGTKNGSFHHFQSSHILRTALALRLKVISLDQAILEERASEVRPWSEETVIHLVSASSLNILLGFVGGEGKQSETPTQSQHLSDKEMFLSVSSAHGRERYPVENVLHPACFYAEEEVFSKSFMKPKQCLKIIQHSHKIYLCLISLAVHIALLIILLVIFFR